MLASSRFLTIASGAVLAAALAACGTTNPSQPVSSYPSSTPVATAPAVGTEYGRITNIEYLPGTGTTTGSTTNSAIGTVLGGVAGGLLGNQVGGGSGKTAATVLGAVGGAVIGNRIGKNRDGTTYTGPAYRVTLQADNGAWRTYEVSSTGELRVGDRVRVENGVIYRG
ncbi:glycine zipper 2TM domain-containing protein [uncultured Ramlibacter sp.]|uniref:glycine zipper 2TM domain-containing protein n=1 Tax=uncultured Ramlibacter sp. TaxID=260755 RepID=UPI0026157AEE|nr:glycine zipper 2TM domain-containing protein [uncultured Ramlibacter sp.]